MGGGEVLSVQLRLMLTAGMLGDKTPFGLGLSSLCWSVECRSQPFSSCKSCLLLFTLCLKLMLQELASSIWRKQGQGSGKTLLEIKISAEMYKYISDKTCCSNGNCFCVKATSCRPVCVSWHSDCSLGFGYNCRLLLQDTTIQQVMNTFLSSSSSSTKYCQHCYY